MTGLGRLNPAPRLAAAGPEAQGSRAAPPRAPRREKPPSGKQHHRASWIRSEHCASRTRDSGANGAPQPSASLPGSPYQISCPEHHSNRVDPEAVNALIRGWRADRARRRSALRVWAVGPYQIGAAERRRFRPGRMGSPSLPAPRSDNEAHNDGYRDEHDEPIHEVPISHSRDDSASAKGAALIL